MSSEFLEDRPSLFDIDDPDLLLVNDDTDTTSKKMAASVLRQYAQETWITNVDAASFNLSSLDVLTFANDTGTITSTDYGIVRNGSSLTFNVGDSLDSYFLDFNGVTAHTFTNTNYTAPTILADQIELINAGIGANPVLTSNSATQVLMLDGDLDMNSNTILNATLDTPTISNFTNATHDHSNAAGGGQLTNSALVSGVFSSITGIGTQSQTLNMGTNLINNVVDPVSVQDAATKNYVDTHTVNGIWTKSGTDIFPTTLTDSVGIGINTPESLFDIAAGSNTTAPLHLTDGSLLTDIAAGSIEYNTDNLYFTGGGYRDKLNDRISSTVAVESVSTWTGRIAADNDGWRDITWAPEIGLFAAVSDIGTNRVMTSPDGINWIARVQTEDNSWEFITWSPDLGLFLALSLEGTNRVMTSPDGITWSPQSAAAANIWKSAAWSPELGIFAAVSSTGGVLDRVMTSPDGINWTSREEAESNTWESIAWSPELGLFVAVSSGGTNRVMTSSNGEDWNEFEAAELNTWVSITWSPQLGLFAAVSQNGSTRVMTSPDGENWIGRTAAEANTWRSITWSPELGLFIAVSDTGTNRIMTSPDGITWTSRLQAEDNLWLGITWSPQLGIFAGVAFSGTNQVMTSEAPTSFSHISTLIVGETPTLTLRDKESFVTPLQNGALEYGVDNLYFTTNPYREKLISRLDANIAQDAIETWNAVEAIELNQWQAISWSPKLGLFAAVSNTGTNRIMTSPDGITWTAIEAAELNQWRSIVWSPELGIFAATASTGTNRVMTSSDGVIWNEFAAAAVNNWNNITWSPELGLFAATSVNGSLNRVMTSPDGEVWTSRTTVNNSWREITWSPEVGLFVAVAASGTNLVMTSPDGITWTTRSASVDNSWLGVVWASELGLFVATAGSGTGDRVMTSPDGINWTTQTSAADNTWNSVRWSPELGILVAVAQSGTGDRIMTSPDGINWTLRTNPEDNTWNKIVWSPELHIFAAVSNTGTNRIMTSTIPIPDSIFSKISVGEVNGHPPSLLGTNVTEVFTAEDFGVPVAGVVTLTEGVYRVMTAITMDDELAFTVGDKITLESADRENAILTLTKDGDGITRAAGSNFDRFVIQNITIEMSSDADPRFFNLAGGIFNLINTSLDFTGTPTTARLGTLDGVFNIRMVLSGASQFTDGFILDNFSTFIGDNVTARVTTSAAETDAAMFRINGFTSEFRLTSSDFNLSPTSGTFFVVDIASTITDPVTLTNVSELGTGSTFYDSTGLDQESIYVTTTNSPNSPDSKNIGSVVVTNNPTATPTTSNTFVDLIFANAAINEGSNIEQWELTDPGSGTNAELTYIGLTDFNGVITATISIDPSQNNRTYAFRIVVDGSATVDAIETPTLLAGSTIVTLPFISPLLITTGQTLRIQIEEVGNSSSPVITDLVIQAQNP